MKNKLSNTAGVKEIARLAKVSIGTVDRVIHNRDGVSDETRKRINAIVAKLDYKPNKMASLLAKRKRIVIGIIIPKSVSLADYWSHPLEGIKKAASEVHQFGLHISYFLYDLNSRESFVKAAKKLLAAGVQGSLIAPSFIEEALSLTSKLADKNIPFVYINSDLQKQPSLSYIGPDLYQSGRLAAQLISFMLQPTDDILVLNMSTVLEPDNHLFRKEQGFRDYFTKTTSNHRIISLNISQLTPASITKRIEKTFACDTNINALFVTNSRIHIIAKSLKRKYPKLILTGYDFIEENVCLLEDNSIRFIISQRPKEQGYLGIMALYRHLFKDEKIEPISYMPIDIITKENYHYYKN